LGPYSDLRRGSLKSHYWQKQYSSSGGKTHHLKAPSIVGHHPPAPKINPLPNIHTTNAIRKVMIEFSRPPGSFHGAC